MKAGITGLIDRPAEGAKEEGLAGFIAGMAKGIVGAVAAPVAGALGAVSRVTEGVDASTRYRGPGVLPGCLIVLPFALPDILGKMAVLRFYAGVSGRWFVTASTASPVPILDLFCSRLENMKPPIDTQRPGLTMHGLLPLPFTLMLDACCIQSGFPTRSEWEGVEPRERRSDRCQRAGRSPR